MRLTEAGNKDTLTEFASDDDLPFDVAQIIEAIGGEMPVSSHREQGDMPSRIYGSTTTIRPVLLDVALELSWISLLIA
ncbi:hypothetical protein E4U32_005837 [Claviceps aff. humidiphila group G2b]|nr:hypothetical protein E4U32_005837 [Claviceps aff. humidiphila group G2b]